MARLVLVALLLTSIYASAQSSEDATFDVFDFVDPLIGSRNGGNVFAGASLPYGMAKAVADVSGQNTGGFSTDGSNVTGFSSMHDSGTGGQSSLGNFPLWPQTSCPGDVIDNCKFGSKYTRAVNPKLSTIQAKPGYFGLALENSISVDMTVTEHTALYRFKFPTTSTDGNNYSPLMLLDLTDLADSRQNASISVDPDTGRMQGNGTFLPSFGSGSFVLHFCADFSGAKVRDTGIWVNDRAGTEPKELFVTRGINLFYIEAGGFVRFHTPATDNTLLARVGMSFISADQACQNAEKEMPKYDFDSHRQDAENSWRKKLSAVSVKTGGVSTALQKTFWTSIYRTMLSPQDYTGENPLWKSAEPYYDSFYCIWDTFRVTHPFLTIIDPTAQVRMIKSLIDTYKHLGWLPDCRMSLCKGFTQGGSNADVVLVDAYVKNLTGIDWNAAYEAVVNDAENEPLDWSVEGRGGLISWKKLNYIPYLDYDYLGFGTNSRSISRTLEYAYDDFCIATLAKGLGKTSDYTKYLQRSTNWRNLYKANQRSSINGNDTGFVGFLQPKYLNGTWGYQDPIACSPLDTFCSLTTNPRETFESSIWEYQFYVPQDQAGLISTLGGPKRFTERLTFLHSSGLLDITNEPSFVTLFQYHYAGRPGLSSQRIRDYIPSTFRATQGGLPGNDDSGTAGALLAFSMAGLFPVGGQSVYLIIPPYFESVSFAVGGSDGTEKKSATIRIANFDPAADAQGNATRYIQSATLNGKAYTKNWVSHAFFARGMQLVLTLGPKESSWGTKTADLPPSYSVDGTADVV